MCLCNYKIQYDFFEKLALIFPDVIFDSCDKHF